MLALFSLLVFPFSFARAHQLEAEYRVLADGRVRIESWFDVTGDFAKGAKVQVFRPAGQLLTEGRLDNEGLFLFSFAEVELLKVVVSAGAGHRKELRILAADLARARGTVSDTPALSEKNGSPPAPASRADRSSRVSIKDVLLGIGFLLALAAFVLSLRNARELREWKEQKTKQPPGEEMKGASGPQ